MIHEIIISGLRHTQSFEQACRTRILNLLEVSPSDASATAELKRGHKGYEGFIRIMSSQGSFFAKAVGKNVNELMKELVRDIHAQIDRWHGVRFQT